MRYFRDQFLKWVTKPISSTSSLVTYKPPKYAESLNSYISACEEDSDLKSFDSSLEGRTIKLISSLAGRRGKTGTLDSLNEVCEFLVDLSQDVVKVITENIEDLSNNVEIKSLVDLYFESTRKTLNLFNTVDECIEKAKIIQLLIRIAVKEFDTESRDNKYAETLKKLNKVKAMEDPFGDEFETQYESVYKEQVMLLDRFSEMQVVLEKKHTNVKKWKTLGNILFATALLSVIALGMLVSSPPVAKVAITLTAPNETSASGVWVSVMLKDYENSVKAHKGLFILTERNKVNIEEIRTIKSLVETLIIRMSPIRKTVEEREEEAVNLVMQEVIEKVEGFVQKIEQIGVHVAECNKSVVSGRVLVLNHIAGSAHSEESEG